MILSHHKRPFHYNLKLWYSKINYNTFSTLNMYCILIVFKTTTGRFCDLALLTCEKYTFHQYFKHPIKELWFIN